MTDEFRISAAEGDDITVVLQAALGTARHKVTLPYGRFLISSTIRPRPGQILEGKGSGGVGYADEVRANAKTTLVWDGAGGGVMFHLDDCKSFNAKGFLIDGRQLHPSVFEVRPTDRKHKNPNLMFEDIFILGCSSGWTLWPKAHSIYWYKCFVMNYLESGFHLKGRNQNSTLFRSGTLGGLRARSRDIRSGDEDWSHGISILACRFEGDNNRRFALDLRKITTLTIQSCHFEMPISRAFMNLRDCNHVVLSGNTHTERWPLWVGGSDVHAFGNGYL